MEKRQRIGEDTLVAGMDIDSDFNAACFMNKEGNILGRYPEIYNSRKGFDYFQTMIVKTKKKHKLTHVLIGMEPTGHYWRKVAFFSQELGYEVRFVRTTAVKHQRGRLDESSPGKNDIRDAYTIGNITREGKYIDTVIEDGIFRQLRTLVHARERMMRSIVGSTHGLQAVLSDYFPELTDFFWSMQARGLWALLETYPFPEDVRNVGLPAITALLAKTTRRKNQAQEKGSVGTGIAYGVSKARLERLTYGLAAEVAPFNIAVNCVKPRGAVDTEGMRYLHSAVDRRRWDSPDMMVMACVFLAAQNGMGVTGVSATDEGICIDHGLL